MGEGGGVRSLSGPNSRPGAEIHFVLTLKIVYLCYLNICSLGCGEPGWKHLLCAANTSQITRRPEEGSRMEVNLSLVRKQREKK